MYSNNPPQNIYHERAAVPFNLLYCIQPNYSFLFSMRIYADTGYSINSRLYICI